MKKITLLDGGLGQEVFRRSGKPADPMWSAKVMVDSPEIVRQVHLDFIQAGARVITLNSYTCTPTRLNRDAALDQFEPFQRLAIQLAQQARQQAENGNEAVQIAGCLPPLIGSYSTDQRSIDALQDEYQQIVELQDPAVDLFIIETMSNSKEAKAAAQAVQHTGTPMLISFTLSDHDPNLIRAGESLEKAIEAVLPFSPAGLLLNCSFPETISQGMEILRKFEIPFGGYANGFTSVEPLTPGGTVDALEARKDLNEEKYTDQVMDWIRKGATIVGGCCEVGPTYIAHLASRLKKVGFELVPVGNDEA